MLLLRAFVIPEDVNARNNLITLKLNDIQLVDALNEIEKQTDYLFVYDKQTNTDRRVSITVSKMPIEPILSELFNNTNTKFVIKDSYVILSSDAKKSQGDSKMRKISGFVKEKNGEPIIGASILVKGTSVGVVSDINGEFTLTIPYEAKMIVVSYIGMKSKEIPIGPQANYNIILEESSIEIKEVVITALGIEKEVKSLSYNVQQLSGVQVNRVSDANFVNNLVGKAAGVVINSSSSGVGGSSRVIMRGTKSISGNNNALYVIDGIPMPSLSSQQPQGVFEGAGLTGDGISNLNAEDIESISILNGPSAAALYGSAAANGVVLVTTRKGKEGKLSLSLTNSTMFSEPFVLPQFQNTYGPSEVGSYYSWGEKLSTPSSYNPKSFFQTGTNISNSMSLTAGNEKNHTYFSLGAVNANGVIHNNDYSRYNMSVRNTNVFLNNKMTLDIGFMISVVKEQNMISQGLYFNPLIPLYLFPPGDDFEKVKVFERYNASNNFKIQYWPYGDQNLSMQNPFWITERNLFDNNKDRYMTNLSLKYEFAPWINVVGRVKMDKNNDTYEKRFNASTSTLFASENGAYSLNQSSTRQIYAEAIVSIEKYLFNNTIGLTSVIGTNIEDVNYTQNMYGGNLQGVPNLFTFTNVNKNSAVALQTGYRKQKQAVFASAQLGYKGMVYLDLTGRNDWASTLAQASQNSFFYPTIGLSGIITDIFKIKTEWMSYLKFRLSYSEVGNEPALFLTIPTYAIAGGFPVTQTRLPNPDLRPERTKSWEGGLNFVFFRNKLKIDATVYNSSTYNQFFEPTLSSSSGYSSVVVNAGRVDNKGVEVSAHFGQDFGDLHWNTTLTYSKNINTIKELLAEWKNPVTGEIISLNEINMGGIGSYKMLLKVGGSMGDVYVNTLKTDEHGAIYVHPRDQVVVADPNTFIYAGNSNPDFNLGWNNMLSWKGISFGALLTARIGGVAVSNTQALMDAFGVSKESANARDNGGAIVNGRPIPAKEYYQTIGGGGATSGIGSMYTYSATNIRLSEFTLGYDIPISKWTKVVEGLNISLVGRNLGFIYRKAPYDPELTANTGTYYQGIDHFMMPSLRNIGFSIKAKF